MRYRVFWSNGDGTSTDAETGEVVNLADHPDMIMLTWGDEYDDEGGDDEPEATDDDA